MPKRMGDSHKVLRLPSRFGEFHEGQERSENGGLTSTVDLIRSFSIAYYFIPSHAEWQVDR